MHSPPNTYPSTDPNGSGYKAQENEFVGIISPSSPTQTFSRIGLSSKIGRAWSKTSPITWDDEAPGTRTRNIHLGQNKTSYFALLGEQKYNGLLDLVNFDNVTWGLSTAYVPKGKIMAWGTFFFKEEPGKFKFTVKDGNDATQPNRTWVVYRPAGIPAGTGQIALWDGVTVSEFKLNVLSSIELVA